MLCSIGFGSCSNENFVQGFFAANFTFASRRRSEQETYCKWLEQTRLTLQSSHYSHSTTRASGSRLPEHVAESRAPSLGSSLSTSWTIAITGFRMHRLNAGTRTHSPVESRTQGTKHSLTNQELYRVFCIQQLDVSLCFPNQGGAIVRLAVMPMAY